MERMNTMWCCGPPCCRTGCCACCGPVQSNKWFPVQLVIYRWVTDPIFDIMVTLLIGVNTIFLALDYHNMPKTLKEVLGWGNQVLFNFCSHLSLSKDNSKIRNLVCLDHYFKVSSCALWPKSVQLFVWLGAK